MNVLVPGHATALNRNIGASEIDAKWLASTLAHGGTWPGVGVLRWKHQPKGRSFHVCGQIAHGHELEKVGDI